MTLVDQTGVQPKPSLQAQAGFQQPAIEILVNAPAMNCGPGL
jgi:hypothetical protein